VIINTKNYYGHLLKWLEHSYTEKFVKDKYRSIYHVSESPGDAMDYIEDYKPIDLPLKW
jgi:predicted Rossmann-fold nucleotide-binding protein